MNAENKNTERWMTIYGSLLRFGVDLFEPNGVVEGPEEAVGVECLLDLRTYFESIESYGRAARVNGFIKEYYERWPDLYKEDNTIFKPNPTILCSTS